MLVTIMITLALVTAVVVGALLVKVGFILMRVYSAYHVGKVLVGQFVGGVEKVGEVVSGESCNACGGKVSVVKGDNGSVYKSCENYERCNNRELLYKS